MLTSKKFIGLALACAGTLAAFTFAQSRASADDGRLAVTPAVYRSADGDGHGATIQLARHGWGGHHGYGYHGGYRGWGGYGYRPYVRPYYGFGAGYGYPAYGYGYPAHGYGYPGCGVGVRVW